MSLPDYLIGFDTETTGVDPAEDRIVTASIVLLDPYGNIHNNWEWLVNPGIPIAEGAVAVHGVSNERAEAEGENPVTAVWEIASVLSYYMRQGVPVVAYNASFDFSLLNAECRRHLEYDFYRFFENSVLPPLILDPYVLDKRLDKYRKGSRTLSASASYYDVELENAHASFDDCIAAVEVTRALWEKYPILSEGAFEDLFSAQRDWYKEQQEGLEKYFRKQAVKNGENPDEVSVNTLWPISTI